LCSLVPGPSRHEAELKDPSGSECQYDNRTKDHREEQRYRQGQVALEDEEVHLDALEVLEDEDENHDQDDDADDERSPRSAEASLSLARVRFTALCWLVIGVHHSR
jgi:hypothetical protein